jgi:hypothetical protein
MNKQKLSIPTGKFGTIKSKYQPESNSVGNDEFTAGSNNFVTNNTGAIEKRPADSIFSVSPFTNQPTDQYEAVFPNGVRHMLVMDGPTLKYSAGNGSYASMSQVFTAGASMEYAPYQGRIYLDNGIDAPMVYDITPNYGGVTYSVPHLTLMGAFAPTTAPIVPASGSSGGAIPDGTYFYTITYVYYGDEESDAGLTSTAVTISSTNQTVALSNIPTGGIGVTARNIYRGNNGSFLLVGTLNDNTTTTFTDTVAAGTTPIPTLNGLPPTFNYITNVLSRNWVISTSTPYTLYWSSPDWPDIFNPNNFLFCNPKDILKGVTAFQNYPVVFSQHSFGTILGNTDNTFYYNEISPTVGCVDNRSIQIRTIDGVPVLIWLSDHGYYKFDGSSATYISDDIEDLVNFNLQQVQFTTGGNSQATEADYAGGVSTPGINLTIDPNAITLNNPTQTFQIEADWESGVLTNIETADGTNELKVPTAFTPVITAGMLGGQAFIDGTDTYLELPVIPLESGQTLGNPSDYTEFRTNTGPGSQNNGTLGFAWSITPTYTGTLGTLTFNFGASGFSGVTQPTYTVYVWNDALGNPGAAIYTGSATNISGNTLPNSTSVSVNVATSLTGGTKYWFGVLITYPSYVNPIISFKEVEFDGVTSPKAYDGVGGSSLWSSVNTANGVFVPYGIPTNTDTVSYTYTQTTTSTSGTWTSSVYDSGSIGSAIGYQVSLAAVAYATFTTGTLYLDASDDSTFNTGVTTQTFVQPGETSYSVTTTNLRYWRFRWSISSTNNLYTPTVGMPILTFNTTGTWISPAINCTSDVTSYGTLTAATNIPSGTSVVVTVATSADGVTYSTYGPFSSAVVQPFIKVQIVLATNAGNTVTPYVSSLILTWNLTSTFTSSIINVGQVPAGWGIFQDDTMLNGGTAQFYFRSASTFLGMSSATYYAVSNGSFPSSNVLPLQYCQWKIVFTASVNAVPVVSGVTVNWFIGNNTTPIRTASLFYNKTYYCSAATLGSSTNNVVVSWDYENKWRVWYGVTINAMGLFFNQPFYSDATRNNVYQWLIPLPSNGSGPSVMMDVRTKAFDLSNINVLKNVRSLRITGLNTGTTIHAYYSPDRGVTFVEMLNVDGALGYTTSLTGTKFSQYFVPDYSGLISGNALVSGSTVMFRVVSSDSYPCTIIGMEPVMYVRSGKYLEVQD